MTTLRIKAAFSESAAFSFDNERKAQETDFANLVQDQKLGRPLHSAIGFARGYSSELRLQRLLHRMFQIW
ncbi:hypothetical protein [uncultured Tateyamaria sp.]|uniref:hypothetical protein n=1 Tax=uncultured Tateyamaria sp. TaxID=455651 RepID=UPI0026241A7F|nr:hypothetical protein [uncultured Tateyamaria sp.]